jgi:hypothetical protein
MSDGYNRTMDIVGIILREAMNTSADEDYYRYIQADQSAKYFYDAIEHLYKEGKLIKKNNESDYKDIKFVDVGGGGGAQVLRLQGVYHAFKRANPPKEGESYRRIDASVIEVNKNLEAVAQMQRVPFENKDALKDKIDFKKYDIIYYYCPISTSKLMQKLEAKIDRKAKQGAIIIALNRQRNMHKKDDQKLTKGYKSIKPEEEGIYGGNNDLIYVKTKALPATKTK